MRASENCSSTTFIDWYVPSNETISNIVLRDLDLSKGFKKQTMEVPSDRKSCICHRMAPLQKLYVITLTYIFKVTKIEMWISRNRWELAKNSHLLLLWMLIFAIEWDRCECCTPWPSSKFSRSNFSSDNSDNYRLEKAKLLLLSDRKSYICHHTALSRMSYTSWSWPPVSRLRKLKCENRESGES